MIVPWAPGCDDRERAWGWLRARYAAEHPEWPIYEGVSDGVRRQEGGTVQEGRRAQAEPPEHSEGNPPQEEVAPWVKAHAVSQALAVCESDVVIVADADVWCDGLELAVEHVKAGAPWAIPHRRVRRLNERSTWRVLDGEGPERLQLEEPSYMGAPGGGIVVLPRETALDIPPDPRFVGWGGEDRAWGWALRILAGEPWRGEAILWHLWHPPQERTDRNHGNAVSEELRRRYLAARLDESAMRTLIGEARRGT